MFIPWNIYLVLYGLGINNVYCEVDGLGFLLWMVLVPLCFCLKETGVATLNKSKKFLVVLETIRVQVGDKWARIEPCSKLELQSTIVFAHPVIKKTDL